MEVLGYSFPNDMHIHWSLMIVMYPYLTGLVAGAFIVSSLYHVFHKEEFKPIGRFSLLTALAFLMVATAPLLNHLGHPERAMSIMFTPNFSSAMAGFGILYSFYFVLVALEVWFVNRKDVVLTARRSTGFKRLFYKVLALGVYNISEGALAVDRKIVLTLAAIGIPGACLLHGYVGFIFGALKANPWWSTPLMPIIFLFSAVVSGIALLNILYQTVMRVRGSPIERTCVSSLASWLWLFMILTVTLELLEIITLGYEKSEKWEVIRPLLTGKLTFSFIGVQMILGSLLSFILLAIVVLMDSFLHDKVRNTLSFIASLLLLIQVFAMRWNVVIGGQIFSKSLKGFRDFHPEFADKEGILVALAIFLVPFFLLWVLERIFPAFEGIRRDEGARLVADGAGEDGPA